MAAPPDEQVVAKLEVCGLRQTVNVSRTVAFCGYEQGFQPAPLALWGGSSCQWKCVTMVGNHVCVLLCERDTPSVEKIIIPSFCDR